MVVKHFPGLPQVENPLIPFPVYIHGQFQRYVLCTTHRCIKNEVNQNVREMSGHRRSVTICHSSEAVLLGVKKVQHLSSSSQISLWSRCQRMFTGLHDPSFLSDETCKPKHILWQRGQFQR